MNHLSEAADTEDTETRKALIEARNLSAAYNGELALENVSFQVMPGERIAIIGPNGAGKSTLLKTILGLMLPRSGTVTVMSDGSHRLGYVPQHEDVSWDFPVTVRDVVLMGRTRLMQRRWPGRADWQAVDAALNRVGMADLGQRQIGELSGGQRRRAFIARALAHEAATLILDEPFSGVDASAQAELMDVLDALNGEGITILLSTHDLDLAFRRFDKVLALRRKLIAFGAPGEVYTREVLAQLYEGRLAALTTLPGADGQPVAVFVDEHGCEDC